MRITANNKFINLVFNFMVLLLFANIVSAKEQSYFTPPVVDTSEYQKVDKLIKEQFNIQLIYCDKENKDNSFVVIGTANIKNGELNYFKNYRIYDQLMDYFKVIEIAPTFVKLAYQIKERMYTYKLSVLNEANRVNANNTSSSNGKSFAFNKTPIFKILFYVSNDTNNNYYFDKVIDVEKKLSFFETAKGTNELSEKLIKKLEQFNIFANKVAPSFYVISDKVNVNLPKRNKLDLAFCDAYLGKETDFPGVKFWYRSAQVSAAINPSLNTNSHIKLEKMKENSSLVSFSSADKLSYSECCLFYTLVLKTHSLRYSINNNILSVFSAVQKGND